MKRLLCMILVLSLTTPMFTCLAESTVRIPEQVTAVSDEAFMGDLSLRKAILHDGVESIGTRAFADSGLRRIRIPGTVNYIADDAFEDVEGLTIQSEGNDYAWHYATIHDIDWMDLEYEQRMDLIDLIEEEPEEYETIDFEEMTFETIPTDGIENETLLYYIQQFNASQIQLKADCAELIGAFNAMEEPINTLLDGAADYSQNYTENGMDIDDEHISADINALSSLPKGLAVLAIYPDYVNGGSMIEADDHGETVYLRTDSNGMFLANQVEAQQIKQSAENLSAQNVVFSADSDSKLDAVLIFAKRFCTDFGNWMAVLTDFMETTAAKADRAYARSELTSELLSYVVRENKAAGLPVERFQPYARSVVKNHAKFGLLKKVAGGCGNIFAVADLGASLNNILQDINMANDIITLNGHGHPTAQESADPKWMKLVDKLEFAKANFKSTLTLHIVFNILDILSTLNSMSTLLKACLGPAGLGIHLAITSTIGFAKSYIRNVAVETIVGTGLDLALEWSKDQMWQCDEAVHAGPVPPEEEPTLPSTSLPPDLNPVSPVNVPDAGSSSYGSGSIPINPSYFPDAGVRAFATKNDFDEDGYLSYEERGIPTWFHSWHDAGWITDQPVQSLKGLDAFYNLDQIDLGRGFGGTYVELSGFPHLTAVHIGDDESALTLSHVRVNNCPALEHFWVTYAQVDGVKVTGCPKLGDFSFYYGSVNTVSISDAPLLAHFSSENAGLENLQLSNCMALQEISLIGSNVQTLNLNGYTELNSLTIKNNSGLKTLGLKGCAALEYLVCENNERLTEMDLADCASLNYLICKNTPVAELNFSACTLLTELNIENTNIREIDVSGNTQLWKIWVCVNGIEKINASGCSSLEQLFLGYDTYPIDSLNLSNCTSLERLGVQYRGVHKLDVSGCTALEVLECHNNHLSELTLDGCTALRELWCRENQLKTLNVRQLTALEELYCNSNQIERLDMRGMTALRNVDCSDNQLTALLVMGCPALEQLCCNTNPLAVLNVKGCVSLTENGLYCHVKVLR